MIKVSKSYIHWNYFLALENDLELVSRYIEFIGNNFKTYSIELAYLLLASSSEIDVMMKQLCTILAPKEKRKDINDYKKIIKQYKPKLVDETVDISRYGLSFTPWENWRKKGNPFWWQSYNNVKHERNNCFNEANLKNVLNSLGALLISNFYYYLSTFSKEEGRIVEPTFVTNKLQPESKLLRLKNEYYLSGQATLSRI